jgi:His-Xaa-Ser system protein HxsD
MANESKPPECETVRFDHHVFSLIAVKKAAYRFINVFSADIALQAPHIFCSLKFSSSIDPNRKAQLIDEFQKEVLDQDLREQIKVETEPIRKLILAHAFSSTGMPAMSAFQELKFYQPASQTYVVLPLRFTGLNDRQYVVTNLAGEFLTLERGTLQRFLQHQLPNCDQAYIDLRARHFLIDDCTAVAPELLALKIRTRYRRLSQFTALHLFVVTLRCEHSCPYCQCHGSPRIGLRSTCLRTWPVRLLTSAFGPLLPT